jgi:hypothetical protein
MLDATYHRFTEFLTNQRAGISSGLRLTRFFYTCQFHYARIVVGRAPRKNMVASRAARRRSSDRFFLRGLFCLMHRSWHFPAEPLRLDQV